MTFVSTWLKQVLLTVGNESELGAYRMSNPDVSAYVSKDDVLNTMNRETEWGMDSLHNDPLNPSFMENP